MLQYDIVTGVPDEPRLSYLLDLQGSIFDQRSRDETLAELHYHSRHHGLMMVLARHNNQLVGFKAGYERKAGHFYSWLGGVAPEFRQQGIASELMARQHAWCRQHGYHTIRTQTMNNWRSMLLLNIRHGFDIIGTQQGSRGLVIVLEKRLS